MILSASERLTQLKDPALFKTRAYIDGEWAGGTSDFAVLDPADNAQIARVPDFGPDEAHRAIASAQTALPAWRARTGKARAAVLHCWFELLTEHADDVAAIMTAEQGKPLAEARSEVACGASFLEWFAEEAKRLNGEVLAGPAVNRKLVILKQPIGVCATITHWDFPIATITRKAAPALAAGCTMVVKPAEQTPLCALALAELARRAGVPRGVFNVVTADTATSIEIGNALCESDVVQHLSLTGSAPEGFILMQPGASTVKKIVLDPVGQAPFIVFGDANLEAAAAGAAIARYRNAGQTRVCTNRFYVHDSIHDAFVAKLAAAARSMRVGNGFEAGVTLGPLIDDAAAAKVAEHIGDAIARGATLVTGGAVREGRFVEPTVLANVTRDMLIAREATFGPVAAVFRFSDEAEAIRLANDTESGLSACFYSRDIGRVWRMAEALEYGTIGINTGFVLNEVAPFSDVRESGPGREGSKYGIDEYVELKYLSIGV